MEQKSTNACLIRKSTLKGEILIPPSKSHTLRAILFATLANGVSHIYNYLSSPDTQAMITACRQMGAQIEIFKNHLIIQGTEGKIKSTTKTIDAGNSGLVLRFCTALAALDSHPTIISGDHSIQTQRVMTPLLQGLSQLGASAISIKGNGYAPVRIQGPLQKKSAYISGEDSQPVSALLIAGSFSEEEIDLYVENPGEKPWVALTLNWLDRLAIRYTHNDSFTHYHLFGKAYYQGFNYTVPGDLSSAAFPIAAALITNSEITIKNIDLEDCQGDKEVIFLFQKMGAVFEYDSKQHTLTVKKGNTLCGIEADINGCVDGITILATLACYAQGESHLYNAAIAKQKECNRLQSITKELKKMGAQIIETSEGVKIQGSALKGAKMHSYQDHRMAMSLIVASLGAEGESCIESIECIAKTFPGFIESMTQLGSVITWTSNS